MEDFKSRFMNIVNHSNKSNDNSVGVYIIHIFSCLFSCVCVCVCVCVCGCGRAHARLVSP